MTRNQDQAMDWASRMQHGVDNPKSTIIYTVDESDLQDDCHNYWVVPELHKAFPDMLYDWSSQRECYCYYLPPGCSQVDIQSTKTKAVDRAIRAYEQHMDQWDELAMDDIVVYDDDCDDDYDVVVWANADSLDHALWLVKQGERATGQYEFTAAREPGTDNWAVSTKRYIRDNLEVPTPSHTVAIQDHEVAYVIRRYWHARGYKTEYDHRRYLLAVVWSSSDDSPDGIAKWQADVERIAGYMYNCALTHQYDWRVVYAGQWDIQFVNLFTHRLNDMDTAWWVKDGTIMAWCTKSEQVDLSMWATVCFWEALGN